jgi:hypothetical protein
MYANKISEKVFDEFDLILNNLSDNIIFDQHFDLNRENDISVENKDGNKHIVTVTISAPLFKYVLKKYLVEKYKYSRPEYLKDFYVASDLVCKYNLSQLTSNRIQKKHLDLTCGYLRYRKKYPCLTPWK